MSGQVPVGFLDFYVNGGKLLGDPAKLLHEGNREMKEYVQEIQTRVMTNCVTGSSNGHFGHYITGPCEARGRARTMRQDLLCCPP